jgi:hypothetical protein
MGMYHINSWTATSDGEQPSLSGIPQNYKHLQLRYVAKSPTTSGSDNSGLFDWVYLRPNLSSTASEYTDHFMHGNGTSVTVGANVQNATAFRLGVTTSSNPSVPSTTWATGIIDILNYSNASIFKTLKSFSGADTGGGGLISLRTGVWTNNSPITGLYVGGWSAGFKIGSRFDLYGIADSSVTGV